MPNGLYCGRKKVCKLKQFIPIKLSVSGQAGTFNDYFRNWVHGYFVNVTLIKVVLVLLGYYSNPGALERLYAKVHQ